MNIKIVTDSTCDLPESIIKKYDITVIPAYINFTDGSYLDGVELSRLEFYQKLPDYETTPTTSAPAIGTFAKVYQELFENGATAILSIHIASTLSGIYNTAVLAAHTFENLIVRTFDAGNLSLGTGLVVEAAAKMAQAGRSLDEILEKVRDIAERTYTVAALDTLKYLRRSGRVSRLKAGLGSILQIKPILRMNRDHVTMDAARTTTGAFQRLLDLLRALGPLEQIALLHTNAPYQAEALKKKIQTIMKTPTEIYSQDVTPVIGSHIGPGAVGFVAVTARGKN
ncbi:MAG: DegV family protein [Chloroflexi bacterium]|nr:DegV family protein [Chloroflexota bacterium]